MLGHLFFTCFKLIKDDLSEVVSKCIFLISEEVVLERWNNRYWNL